MTWMSNSRAALLSVTLAGALLSIPLAALASETGSPQPSDAAARLDKKQFENVKVSVDQGIATLTGTVDLYQYKVNAEKRARKSKGVTSVHNLISVAGPVISDQQLQDKLQEKLAYDRVFLGNAFNAITLGVRNGAVTLGGHAVSYNSRDSALDLVRYYPGVKDMTDEIQVDPVSIFDNRIRIQVYRSVYGYPTFTKYAMNPAKPIRISVQNGNVSLYGAVDSQADKDIAFMRANGVAGVFSVKNFLYVAPQETKKPKVEKVEKN